MTVENLIETNAAMMDFHAFNEVYAPVRGPSLCTAPGEAGGMPVRPWG